MTHNGQQPTLSTKVGFLDLPREIRDIVYEHLLTDENTDFPRDFLNEPDPDHKSFSQSWRSENSFVRDEVLKSHVYIRRSTPMRCAALLRSCRKVHQEVMDCLHQLNLDTDGFTARLDMAFVPLVNGLFLEWTSVPVPFHFIKHVRIRAWGWEHWADSHLNEQQSIPRNPNELDVRRLAAFAESQKPWLQFVPMVLAAYIVHGPGFTHQKRYTQKLPAMETLTIQNVRAPLLDRPEKGYMDIGRSMPAVILSSSDIRNHRANHSDYLYPSTATKVFMNACRDIQAVGALIGRVKTLRVLHEDGQKAREWHTSDMKDMHYIKCGHFRPAARVAVLYRTATEWFAHCCEPQVGEDIIPKKYVAANFFALANGPALAPSCR